MEEKLTKIIIPAGVVIIAVLTVILVIISAQDPIKTYAPEQVQSNIEKPVYIDNTEESLIKVDNIRYSKEETYALNTSGALSEYGYKYPMTDKVLEDILKRYGAHMYDCFYTKDYGAMTEYYLNIRGDVWYLFEGNDLAYAEHELYKSYDDVLKELEDFKDE